MEILITGKNVFKSVGFCPNPVAKFGIPEYADSVTFPSVVGTQDHLKYWEDQVNHCIQGYHTGGTWIPGRLYYYLNFSYMSSVGRGFHHPDFVDTDLDYFYLVEYCKINGKGVISIKARRKGLSFKANKGIIEYGTKFLGDLYKAGICAGIKDYAEDFSAKLTETESLTAPEFKLNVHKANMDERIYGYHIRDEQGGFVLDGSKNTVIIRTAFQSGNIFKGLHLDDCIFEESGEFPNLLSTYEATKWCFMDGEKMVGTPYIYGTGGKMGSSSKDFAQMWSESESYNLEKFWVPGTKIYKPCYIGFTDNKGIGEARVPNIDYEYRNKKVQPEQLLGMEDYDEAERQIIIDRKQLAKSKNKKALTDHVQNFPLTVEEAFISSSENNYDSSILNARILDLMGKETLYHEMVIEPKKDENGGMVFPMQHSFRLPTRDADNNITEPRWKIIHLYKYPDKGIRFLDAVGIDSYDQDKSNTSSSLGAVLVDRQEFKPNEYWGPIVTYYQRPPRKEQFYLVALLISMAYSSANYTLVDAGTPMIIDYFITNHCEHLLGYRPKAFESPNSEQMHNYGLKFTTYNRPILESLIQSEILDNAHNWPFPELCKDCNSYNTGDNENDQDLHDAFILAKAQHKDRKINPTLEKSDSVNNQKRVLKRTKEGYVYYEKESSKNTRLGGDLFMDLIARTKF
jgi:hypothetical protein